MIMQFKVFASIADRISWGWHCMRHHITKVMPAGDGCMLIECSCGEHAQVRRNDDGSAEIEHATCRRWSTLAKLQRRSTPSARALKAPARVMTHERCSAYWDDYIAAWGSVGATVFQQLTDPGPPEDTTAGLGVAVTANDGRLNKEDPCGNDDCDKCDPRPRWKISQHRIQHLTYTRKIKAATAAEALKIFEDGTAWPSQYDDKYGKIVQLDAPVTKRLPPDKYHLTDCCYHDLPSISDFCATGCTSITADAAPSGSAPEDENACPCVDVPTRHLDGNGHLPGCVRNDAKMTRR